jgi:hypothetical protein
MNEMKFEDLKLGMKVKIRDDLVIEKDYGNLDFSDEMECYLGKEVTIKKITRMVSFKLKPLFLKSKLSVDEFEQFNAKGLYSVLRGYRGTLRDRLAALIGQENKDAFFLTFAAAEDFKRAADTVVDTRSNEESRFYQRRNSSSLYHRGFTLYHRKPSHNHCS